MTAKYVILVTFILGSIAVGIEAIKELNITVNVGKNETLGISSSPTTKPTTAEAEKSVITQAKPTTERRAIVIPSPTQARKTTNSNSSRCIVTLFGNQYDVTPLIGSHSGGDVFSGNCNTDMSAIYQKQHGTSVAQMQAYLITNNSNGVMPTAQAQNNQNRRDEREDEDDD